MLSGRDKEVTILNNLLQTNQSELLAVAGRRRVGKTFLIKSAYDGSITFQYTGKKDATKKVQLERFSTKLSSYYNIPFKAAPFSSWDFAFDQLKEYILSRKTKKKKVIFLDEMPWIATHKSGFLSAFEYFWNDWAVNQNIIVVVCGSATSWIIKNVLNNTGGLHNRVTKYINLKPFTLSETESYFKDRKINMPHYEIIQIYMAMGGIPHYLKEIKKGESAIQNIDRICFDEYGLLVNEFDNLYKSLFDNYENYEEIIRLLANKRMGLTRSAVIKGTSHSNGGGLTRILNELEESSFIRTYQPFDKEIKQTLYRLTDEYSAFYINFIENKRSRGKGVWIKMSQTSKYKSWSGFTFEGICIKHIQKIKTVLGISGIYTEESSFVLKGNPGFQIDMIIDRADNAINICEMKYYNGPYTLNKSQAEELQARREIFRAETKTKKYLFNTLVTTFGLKEGKYNLGIIDHVITMDQLF